MKKLYHLFVLIFLWITVNVLFCPFNATAQVEQKSALLRRFVRTAEGTYDQNTGTQVSFSVFLNGKSDRLLLENAPQWKSSGDNIEGNGVFNVQLGNFPELTAGDSATVRFTDMSLGEQGELQVVIDTLPWNDPNPLESLQLEKITLPDPPQNVEYSQDNNGYFTIRWDAKSDVTYLIYRRNLQDTLADGKLRNLYTNIANGLTKGTFIDSTTAVNGSYSYILYAKDTDGQISAHSKTKNESSNFLSMVPRPIIPSHPEFISMYDKAWQLGMENSKHGTETNGFVDWYVDEGFDNRIFQWDTCFMLAWAKYSQGALPNIKSLDNFYRKQHPDGAISGVIRESDGTDDQPESSPWFTRNNLFSWAEWEYYKTTGDSSRFDRVIPILADYARWVKHNRRHPNGHYYWSGWSSGMDNSPRSKADQFYPPYSWIDYDANEALAARYLARMAGVNGDQSVEKEFNALHDTLKTLVNRDMWSNSDEFYWDLDKDGSFMKISGRKVMTVASFWPMWADITGEVQNEGLVRHLNNSSEFNRAHRVPTLAADDPAYSADGDYWRGSVWAPTNHMIVKGLITQGYKKLAREIVVNHLNNVAKVFQDTGTLWENYSPEFAQPGNDSRSDFVGWSAVGPIAELIENYIGINLNVPDHTINWNLLTTEEVGLRNLQFGDFTIQTIKAKARSSLDQFPTLVIDTPEPFKIQLEYDGGKDTLLQVQAGNQVITSLIKETSAAPRQVTLHPNYPNPFNPYTTISYSLPKREHVKLEVFNAAGQKMAILVNKRQTPGSHLVRFNGARFASGVYFYRLKGGGITRIRKMLLLK